MKICSIATIIIFLTSCKGQNKELIIGKWQPITQHRKENDYLYNWTITFNKDSTAILSGMSKSNPVIYQLSSDSIFMYSTTQAFSINAKIKFNGDYMILNRKGELDTLKRVN